MQYIVIYYDSESGEWEDTLGKDGMLTNRWIQGLAELLNRYAADGWVLANERGAGTAHIIIMQRAN